MYLRHLRRKGVFLSLLGIAVIGASASGHALALNGFSSTGLQPIAQKTGKIMPMKSLQQTCSELIQEKHFSYPSSLPSGLSHRQVGAATLGLAFGARHLIIPHSHYHIAMRANEAMPALNTRGVRTKEHHAKFSLAWRDYKRCINT